MSAEIMVMPDAPNLDDLGKMTVTDKASEEIAAGLFSRCDATVKDIESKRTAKVKPLNDIVRDINQLAKTLAEPYVTAKDALRRKMSEWRSGEGVRQAEAERNMLANAARNAVVYGNDIDRGLELDAQAKEIAAVVPKTVGTESGTVRFRTDLVIDSVDIEKLHPRYVVRTADRRLILSDLKSGLNVDGVAYHEERTPVNYKTV